MNADAPDNPNQHVHEQSPALRLWSRCACKDRNDRLLHDNSLPESLVNALTHDPESLLDHATMLKDGNRSRVLKIIADDRPLVLKQFLAQDTIHSLVHAGMRTRARWNVVNSLRLLNAGINVPKPRALREAHPGMRRTQSWFICDFIEGPTLSELTCAEHGDDVIEANARAFAVIWNQLDQAALRHDDLKATNIIRHHDGSLWLLDLDGMRHIAVRPLLRHYRRKDRERFMRNWSPGSPEHDIYARLTFNEPPTQPATTSE